MSARGLIERLKDLIAPFWPKLRLRVILFGVLLFETRHLPTGETPCYRRRLPHPELPALTARIAPQLAAWPMRSRWGRV